MASWVKVLLVLALVLPMAAYVAGSLTASGPGEVPHPEPVVIQNAPSRTVDTRTTLSPSGPSRTPDDDRDEGDDDGADDGADDGDVRIVTPRPTRVDDDGDDDDDDDDGDDGNDDGDDDREDGDD